MTKSLAASLDLDEHAPMFAAAAWLLARVELTDRATKAVEETDPHQLAVIALVATAVERSIFGRLGPPLAGG